MTTARIAAERVEVVTILYVPVRVAAERVEVVVTPVQATGGWGVGQIRMGAN